MIAMFIVCRFAPPCGFVFMSALFLLSSIRLDNKHMMIIVLMVKYNNNKLSNDDDSFIHYEDDDEEKMHL